MRYAKVVHHAAGCALNLMLIFVALLLLLDLPGLVPAKTGMSLYGWTAREVLTASMEPAYPVGSLVYFHEVDPEQVAVGDVIAYEGSDGSVTAHRVVAINTKAKTFSTKGDANESEDPAPVPFASCRGTAKASIPHLGTLLATVQEQPLASSAIVLTAGLVLSFASAATRADRRHIIRAC